MTHRRFALCVGALLLASACGAGVEDDDSAGSTESTAGFTAKTLDVPSEPTGVIALGHSLNTGFNADPDRPGTDAGEYSWATGTSPEVDSIYTRLVEADPRHEGHVTNRSVNGSLMAELASQWERAVREVPNPALVLIMTVDNDIRCDGTDADNVASVGEDLAEALARITDDAPDAQIVVAGSTGRPADYVAMFDSNPTLEIFGGDGLCDLFDANRNRRDDGIAALTRIIEAYEAEMARVCATTDRCADAIATAASIRTDADSFSGDLNHPSIEGHREIAEAMWPRVAEVLGVE